MSKRVLLGFTRPLSVVVWVVLLSQMPAIGQETSADILGTVTDPSGAVIPGATVKLINLGTQITQGATSNSVGDYLFTLLTPGKYSLSVAAPGFKTVVVPVIALAAGDRNRESAVLASGAAAETVTVTADASLLQRESSSLTSVVTEQPVQDLPLNDRNVVNLVQIQPGVNAGSPDAISSGQRPDDRRLTSTISANGQSDLYNNQLVDGMDNNEREQGVIGVRPSIDAIAEVKVDTNNFAAEVGRDAGAVVNVITKSGTNRFHGSAYEFFRNDIFDARDFFAKQGEVVKPAYHHNQFGGSIGGPIRKDKTFSSPTPKTVVSFKGKAPANSPFPPFTRSRIQATSLTSAARIFRPSYSAPSVSATSSSSQHPTFQEPFFKTTKASPTGRNTLSPPMVASIITSTTAIRSMAATPTTTSTPSFPAPFQRSTKRASPSVPAATSLPTMALPFRRRTASFSITSTPSHPTSCSI